MRREEGYKESIHETEKPLREEKIVWCLRRRKSSREEKKVRILEEKTCR
jgi:hypothetical protein